MGKFKVGDRVRFVSNSSGDNESVVGKTGVIFSKKTQDSYYDWTVKLDEYNVNGHDGDGDIPNGYGRYAKDSDLEPVAVAQQSQLTIRAGRDYKTRDGRKVGPAKVVGDLGPHVDWDGRTSSFYIPKQGNYTENGLWLCGGGESVHDLIAEWVDEPAVAAKGEPKFKVGDRVKFVDDYGGPARGKEATVVKLGVWGEGKGIQVDQGGKWGISTEHAHSLRLVAPATSGKPAIVALIENGQPKPAKRPFVHPYREAATKEARRLAGKHKGREFGVYELVDTAKEAKVYEHEWQQLAANKKTGDAAKEMRKLTGLSLGDSKRAVERWLGNAA